MERVEIPYETTTDAMKGLRSLIKEHTQHGYDYEGHPSLVKPEVRLRLFPDYGYESAAVVLPLTSVKTIMEAMERACVDKRGYDWRENRRCVFTLWYYAPDSTYRKTVDEIYITMTDEWTDLRQYDEDKNLVKDENGDVLLIGQ